MMDRSLASMEKPCKTTTVLSTDLNSTERYAPAPDELIRTLTKTQMFCPFLPLQLYSD